MSIKDLAVRAGVKIGLLTEKVDTAPAIATAQAVASIATSLEKLANFVTSEQLPALLSGAAKSHAASSILNGLAMKDGRNSMDARFIKQNALEITEIVEAVHGKFEQRMKEKMAAERVEEMVDSEAQNSVPRPPLRG